MTTKTCTKCGEVKPLEAFHVDNHRKDGRGVDCRRCVNAARVQRYRDRDDVREKCRLYRIENASSAKVYHDAWRLENKEELTKKRRLYEKSHPLIVAAGKKRHKVKHRDSILIKSREYHTANRPREALYKIKYRAENPHMRKAQKQKSVTQLQSGYIAYLIARRLGVSASNIPQDLIEAKRAHLKLARLIKEYRI